MPLFESYERRINQINAELAKHGISSIEAAGNTIAKQMGDNGWSVLNADKGIYVLSRTVNALGENDVDVDVFANFTIDANAAVDGFVTETNAKAKIEVIAYAVQADGFANAAAAWNATFGAPDNG